MRAARLQLVFVIGSAFLFACGEDESAAPPGNTPAAEQDPRRSSDPTDPGTAGADQGSGTEIPREPEADGRGGGEEVDPQPGEQPPVTPGQGVKVVLPYTWFGQPNGYWCGPGSTRMALGTRMKDPPSQQTLATYMGTDTNGTDHIGLPANALNKWLTPGTKYVSRTINDPPTQAQRDRLKKDLVARIGSGWPIVANVISGWRPPGYPTGTIYHYVAVVGYDEAGDKALIADPAAEGSAGTRWKNVPRTYWVTTQNLATWIGGKGYTG